MEDALEIHAYYSKMFEAYASLPADDISLDLFKRAAGLWAEEPWGEFGKFLKRVEARAEGFNLSPARGEAVAKFLAKQKPHFERCCWLVEKRPRLIQADGEDLIRRLDEVRKGLVWGDFETVDRNDTAALAAHFERVKKEVEHRRAVLLDEAIRKAEKEMVRWGEEAAQWEKNQQAKQALKAGYKALLPVLQAVIDYSRGEEFVCYNFVDMSDVPSNLVKKPDLFEPWLNIAEKPELKTYRRKLAGILEIDVQRLDTLKSSFESGAYSLNDLQSEFAGVEIVLPTLGQWISPAHNSVAPTFWEGLKAELLRVHPQSELRYNLVSEKLGKSPFNRVGKAVLHATPEPERKQAPATGQRRASEPKTAKMRDTFTVDDVRAILRSTDMGIRYNEPGEWAAAFRALYAKGILTGGATAIKRWADSTGYGGNFSKSTLIIPWRDEWNEPADTNNEAQRLVFKSIADSCQSLLDFRQLQA